MRRRPVDRRQEGGEIAQAEEQADAVAGKQLLHPLQPLLELAVEPPARQRQLRHRKQVLVAQAQPRDGLGVLGQDGVEQHLARLRAPACRRPAR